MTIPEPLALAAVRSLVRARADLAGLVGGTSTREARWHVVEDTADRLAEMAADPGCSKQLAAILLDWRDRLGSHLLVSRALADLDVHPAAAEQLLLRGLDEAIGEAPRRLAGNLGQALALPA